MKSILNKNVMKQLFIFLALMTGAVSAGMTQVVSDFEGGTSEDWRAEGDGVFYWENGTGNPGSCMRLDDEPTGDMNRSFAPLKFLGNWSAATANDTLKADIFLHPVATTYVTTNYLFRISGPGGQATGILNPHPGFDVWTTYKISLAQSDWQLNSGSWTALLQNVTTLIVTMEFISGDEFSRLDNVSLSFSPSLVPVVPSVCSGFEDGTFEGWSFQGTGGVTNQSSGGSPGRYVQIANGSATAYGFAPTKFLGIWTGLDNHAAEICFDLLVTTTGALQTTDAFVRISGPGGVAKIAMTSNIQEAFGQWHTFAYPILESSWTIESGTWNQIMAQVSELRMCLEFSSSSETVGLDDFCISNLPPVADFAADYTYTFVGNPVQFTDRSDKVPTGWSWTFGDAGTGTEQDPVHFYSQAGLFDVSLTATNYFGNDTKQVTGYIEVAGIDECLKYSDNFSVPAISPAWRMQNGTWAVYSGALRQSSNYYGTSLNDGCYAITGSCLWSGYFITADLESTDNDQIGLVFNFQDPDNMYMFIWQLQTPLRQLYKWVNGTGTILASDDTGYTGNTWYNVKAGSFNGNLRVMVDGAVIFNVTDNTFTAGKAGLYCRGNQNSLWDNVLIECAVNDSIFVQNDTVHGGETECFEALEVITTGGSGTIFVVESDAAAHLIAGHHITMLPVTHFQAGSQVHAYIGTAGQFCNNILGPVNAGEEAGIPGDPVGSTSEERSLFRIYPNPTTGSFTLELSSEPIIMPVTMRCYDLMGTLIMEKELHSGRIHELSCADQMPGIYLIRVIQDGGTAISKIIRQ